MRTLRLLLRFRATAAGIRFATLPYLLALVFPGAAPAQGAPRPSPDSALISALERRIPLLLDSARVPGLQIALIMDGRVSWTGAFGVADAATGRPVTDATIFEAASLSKPLFAWTVLQLVDAGRLDLDAPLSRYLPEPYVPDDPRLHAITARRVLTHTPGLPNWRNPRNGPLPILWEPGTRWSYSGEGYVYLQRAVEGVTGEGLDAVARRLAFQPAGMPASSYVWRQAYDTLKAAGHDEEGRSRGVARRDRANAAASLHTTAEDYARFLVAILRGERLRPATREALRSSWVAVDSQCVNCASRDEAGPPSSTLSWGLGWGIERGPQGDLIWHWGDNGAQKAFVIANPATGRGLVLLTNGQNGLGIAPAIVQEVFPGTHSAFEWLGN